MRVLLEAECPGEEILYPGRRLERAKRVFEGWASTMSEYFNVKVRVLADSDGDGHRRALDDARGWRAQQSSPLQQGSLGSARYILVHPVVPRRCA